MTNPICFNCQKVMVAIDIEVVAEITRNHAGYDQHPVAQYKSTKYRCLTCYHITLANFGGPILPRDDAFDKVQPTLKVTI